MRRKLILTCFLFCSLFSCSENKNHRIIQDYIDEISLEYAPDKRTALFDIRLENGGALTLKGETSLPLAKAELIRRIEQNRQQVIDKISVLPNDSINKKYGLEIEDDNLADAVGLAKIAELYAGGAESLIRAELEVVAKLRREYGIS